MRDFTTVGTMESSPWETEPEPEVGQTGNYGIYDRARLHQAST